MLALNPVIISHELLPPSSSTAFFASESKELIPPAPQDCPVYKVVESSSGERDGTWRGGWAKRFIPDSIVYETSMEPLEGGMRTTTHAPVGVHSVTTWNVREGEGDEGLVLEERGCVTSNR
jgi:hypothetical protein